MTELGIENAQKLANALRGKTSFSAIYVGDYVRYKLTADIINFNNAPVFIDSRLNESGSDDEFVGIVINENNRQELYERHAEVLKKRTHAFLDDIVSKHSNDENILCVSSGVNLGEFMSYFYPNQKRKGLKISYAIDLCPVVFWIDKNKM